MLTKGSVLEIGSSSGEHGLVFSKTLSRNNMANK
ncbi:MULTISPECIES: hypothetical protein [Prochlorococcus]